MKWICKNQPVSLVTNGGYTIDQILDNKHCSKNPSYWHPIQGTEKYLFKSTVAESWEFFDPLIKNPISNTNQIYLRFLDVSVFTETRDTFILNGYYCSAPEDTIAFESYWDDQEEYVWYGMEVDGVRISNRYYWWLNFGRLKATDPNSKRKYERFPEFVDHQYYWSLELEEAGLEGIYANTDIYLNYFPNKKELDFKRLRKEGMVVAKGRRKGYSYFKASALHVFNFTWLEDSKNILAAFEKTHYGTPLKAIHDNLNFLNKNTPWVRRRDVLNRRDNFRASVKIINEFGVEIEEGYKSEVSCISFQDDPFKGIGDSADYVDIEEAGKFVRLLETYEVSVEPVIRDGDIMIGIPLIGGTAGDMEKGSADLYDIHSNPKAYRLKGYENIYDDKPNETVGWFIDDMWYLPGFIEKETVKKLFPKDKYLLQLLDKYNGEFIETVDKQGNSHRRFAEIIIDQKRKIKKRGNKRAYDKFISQQPKTLFECFLMMESSPFDTNLAKEGLAKIKVQSLSTDEWGEFIIDGEGEIQWRFDTTKQPITEFPIKNRNDNKDGCWVIYEKPRKNDGIILWNRYLAGCDPIDKGEDEVNDGNEHSLASTFIMDSFTRTIVAEYTGRPGVSESYYEQLWRGIQFYKALLLYENNLKGLYSYFRSKDKLYLLAKEPESLRDKMGYNLNKNPTLGVHATPAINQHARNLINTWTLENHVVGQNKESGENIIIPKMLTIKSAPLLQEIIRWKPKLNCDRISALGMTLILLEDRTVYLDSVRENVKNRLEDKFFSRIHKVSGGLRSKQKLFENILNRRM